MKNDEERKEFSIKYNGVTPYTMNKLKALHGESLNAFDNRNDHIFKAAFFGIIALSSSILPISTLGNAEFIKENLYKFLLLGVGVPTITTSLSIKNIKSAIEDNKYLNEVLKYLEYLRRDIPMSLIEDEYEKDIDENTELNRMIEESEDPKIVKNIRKLYFRVLEVEDINN